MTVWNWFIARTNTSLIAFRMPMRAGSNQQEWRCNDFAIKGCKTCPHSSSGQERILVNSKLHECQWCKVSLTFMFSREINFNKTTSRGVNREQGWACHPVLGWRHFCVISNWTTSLHVCKTWVATFERTITIFWSWMDASHVTMNVVAKARAVRSESYYILESNIVRLATSSCLLFQELQNNIACMQRLVDIDASGGWCSHGRPIIRSEKSCRYQQYTWRQCAISLFHWGWRFGFTRRESYLCWRGAQ